MNLSLHGYWRSSASYRVRIALNIKQLPFEYVPVHLVKGGGEQHSDDYKKLNPSSLVPTFVDHEQDLILNQSLAIMEYLEETYPQTTRLLPTEPLARAQVRILVQDIACDVQPIANLRILQKLKKDFDADENAVKNWCNSIISNAFDAYEQRLQQWAGEFSYGDSVTLADVCLVPQVYNALRFEVDMQKYPTIWQVYNNCQALDAFKRAAPEQQPDAS